MHTFLGVCYTFEEKYSLALGLHITLTLHGVSNHQELHCLFNYFQAHNKENTLLAFFVRHDDVIKWKHFPRYCPFVWGIHRWPVNSPHKGQWLGALIFPLIYTGINSGANNREADDLRRYCTHYDVTVMRRILQWLLDSARRGSANTKSVSMSWRRT